MNNRTPAVAGSFYPDTPAQLKSELEHFLTEDQKFDIAAKALIVPHAGYCYSGTVAGKTYSYLNKIQNITKVILLGPSHRVALQGCAVASHQAFVTPLGKVKVDSKACQRLIDLDLAILSDQAHQWEHSLEVQLPFLQTCLADFELIPLVVGDCQPKDISEILEVLIDKDSCQVKKTSSDHQTNSLIVVSTDLSHFHPYHLAQTLDNQTIKRILTLQSNIAPENACGCHALNGLLDFCKKKSWQVKLINKANSADVSDQTLVNKERVVGYASFIVY